MLVTLSDNAQDDFFELLVIMAFVFKLLETLHLLYTQTNVDIFFVDWEKARGQLGNKSMPISIWRTYFVANEWNELQAMRKVPSPSAQPLMSTDQR